MKKRMEIARRRNRILRDAKNLQTALQTVTGWQDNDMVFLSAEDSVHLDDILVSVYNRQKHVKSRFVENELSWKQVQNAINRISPVIEQSRVIVFLLQNDDLPFEIDWCLLKDRIWHLLEFDENMITIIGDMGESGMLLDRDENVFQDTQNVTTYTLERWGSFDVGEEKRVK